MLISSFALCRVKFLLSLTAVVVSLQFLVFVADQVWLQDDVVKDCTAEKIAGTGYQVIKNERRTASSQEIKDMKTDVYSQEKEFENAVNRTNPEIQTSAGETYQIINQTEGISNRKTGKNLTTESTTNEQQTSRNIDEKTVKNFTERAVNKEMSQDSAAQKEYNCRQLRERQSVNGYLNMHTWYGWCGMAVDDLRREPLFPFRPHVNDRLGRFATNVTVKRKNTGRRIFGYVHPRITGDYAFAISSADGSELWLSTDDDPHNSRKIAYLGEPGDDYAASTRVAEFRSRQSQISEKIRLAEENVYYIEVLQKQKRGVLDHVEVAWQIPGKEQLEIIDSKYISQYIDYAADEAEIKARKKCICKDHPTLPFAFNKFMSHDKYDIREDFHSRVETLAHSEVSDVLPSCPYTPSYLVSRKMDENEAIAKGYILRARVYPDDNTDKNQSHDINNHISWGNPKLPKQEALDIVSKYMEALRKRKGDRFTLKSVINVEEKKDHKKGVRYLLELELFDNDKGRSVRLSEYIYKPNHNSTTDICYPEGFQWKRNVSVSVVVTVKNYGPWIKFLIDQLAWFYKRGTDRNFFLVIVDFNSTDVDIFKMRERSEIKDRIIILKYFTEFHKTKALNDGVRCVKDPNSIIFTADLHIKFPAHIFDEIRKHTIQGRSFYSPAVLKLKCGYSITHQQAFWEMMGYGLFGGYKSDWDRFEGMDEAKFTTRWGGEDWDLMDRAIGANLEIERLRLPKFYHYFHERSSDWYENARI